MFVEQRKVLPLVPPLAQSVFPLPGTGDPLHQMMRNSISTAGGTALPAITPRSGHNAARTGRYLQAAADSRSATNKSAPKSNEQASPAILDSPISHISTGEMHTWIEPIISRPSTHDGKEISEGPWLKQEQYATILSSHDFSVEISREQDSPSVSPILVQGIGSVSVRLLAAQDECVVHCEGLSPSAHHLPGPLIPATNLVGDDIPAVALYSRATLDGAGNEVRLIQQYHFKEQLKEKVQTAAASQRQFENQFQMKQYRDTSAFAVLSPEDYATKSVLPGGGFSKNLIRLADPRSRIFQYPTPSEALTAMSKRSHAQVQAPCNAVVIVGGKAPAIDQTYYTLKQMKRQWLMQYSKENPDSKAPEPPKLKTVKRDREDVHVMSVSSDTFGRPPPTGDKRTSRPMSREVDLRPGSATSPWTTSPTHVGDEIMPPVYQTRPASKPSHGYGSPPPSASSIKHNPHVPDRQTNSLQSYLTQGEAVQKESQARMVAESQPRMGATVQRSGGSNSHQVALAMPLSPIGEFSLDSSVDLSHSPHLIVGLSMENYAVTKLVEQKGRTPSNTYEAGLSSPSTPWADHYQKNSSLFGPVETIDEQSTTQSVGSGSSHNQYAWPRSNMQHASLRPSVETDMHILGTGKAMSPIKSMSPVTPRGTAKDDSAADTAENFKRRKRDVDATGEQREGAKVSAQREQTCESVLTIHSPHFDATILLVDDSISSHQKFDMGMVLSQKRKLIVQEMQKRDLVSDGNRALLRCQDQLQRKQLKNAMASLTLAYSYYGKADVLHEKIAHLEHLQGRIVQTTLEYHDFQEQNATPTLPRPPAVGMIRVPFRGPDRLQPDGLYAKTRGDLEHLQKAAVEEETQRIHQMHDLLQQSEVQAAHVHKDKEPIYAQKSYTLKQIRIPSIESRAQSAITECIIKDELQVAACVVSHEFQGSQDLVSASVEMRAAESARSAAEDLHRREEEQRLAVLKSQRRKQRIAEEHRLLQIRAGQVVDAARIDDEVSIATCFDDLVTATTACAVEEQAAHALRIIEAETVTRRIADEDAREILACVEELIAQVVTIDAAEHDVQRLTIAEKEERMQEAFAQAGVEAEVLAEATAEVTLDAIAEFYETILDEVMPELAKHAAREARVQVQEDVIAEGRKKEEDARLEAQCLVEVMEDRKQRGEDLRLAKLVAVMQLEAYARRVMYGAAYAQMLLDLSAEDWQIWQEQERARRLEQQRLALLHAAEKLQGTVRTKTLCEQHLLVSWASVFLKAACSARLTRSDFVVSVDAAVTLQAAGRQILANASYLNDWEACTLLQGVVRRRPISSMYAANRDGMCMLQVHMRSYLDHKWLAARLESNALLVTYARQQLARQAYTSQCSHTILLQTTLRRHLVPVTLIEMQSSACILQTCCRRTSATRDLMYKQAVISLEPRLQRAAANHGWCAQLLAGARLLSSVQSCMIAVRYQDGRQAAELLKRIVRRVVDLTAYHTEVIEVRRFEDEERKRLEDEEKARVRELAVADKQREIMGQMEAKARALKDIADAEAAREAERKRMLAQYAKPTAAPKQEKKEKAEATTSRHATKSENETFALAANYEREKMYPDAITELMSIMTSPSLRMAVLLKRGTCLGKLGMRKDCFRDFEVAIREYPYEHLPFYMRALHHVQWKNDELALRDIQAALSIFPDHAESLNLRASLSFKNGFYVDAITMCNRALAIKRDLPQLYIIRGSSRERLGVMQEACDDLETAIMIMLDALPSSDTQMDEDELKTLFTTLTDKVFMTFADACLANKQTGTRRAMKLFNRVLKFTSSRAVVHALRARVHCDLNNFAEAGEDFEHAEKAEEDNSSFLLLRAQFTRSSDAPSAINDCIRAATVDSSNFRAHLVRGKIHEEQKNSRDALDAYMQALKGLDTGVVWYESAVRAGALQFKLSEGSSVGKQEAFALLRQAACQHAPRFDSLITLARFLEAGASYRSAVKTLTRVIHMDPTQPRNYLVRSQCLLMMGNKAEALRDRQRALQLDSRTDPDILQNKIEDLIDSKDYEGAQLKIQEAIAAHPNNALFQTLLGKVYYLVGDQDKAKTHFDDSVRIGTARSETYSARGEFRLKTGNPKDAIDDFTKSIEMQDSNLPSYLGRGESMLMTGNSEKAWQDLNAALAFDPENKKALHLRAMASEREGNYTAALEDYAMMLSLLGVSKATQTMTELLTHDSDEQRKFYFFEAHMKSGLVCTKRRDFARAIEHYNQVLKVQPSNVMALVHRGIAFHSHGYHDSGISDYTRALVAHPGHVIVLQNRARALAFQKHWTRAILDIEAMAEAARGADVWSLLASCFFNVDQKQSALKAIDRCLQLDHLSLPSLILKADILEQLYPLQRAPMSYYTRALRLHPSSQLCRLKNALAVAKRGFLGMAIKHLHAARSDLSLRGVSDGPEHMMVEELGAMIMIEAAMPCGACQVLDTLLQANAKHGAISASLLTARGVMHQQEKDMVTARTDFARAVQADPTDADVHYNLGCFRLQEMDWRGAYASFTKTIALRPKNTLAMLNRGVALYQMHRVQEAQRDFDSVLALDPECGQALLNRGVMHQVAGRHAEAEIDLSKALEQLDGSHQALHARINLYQSIGKKDMALRDNATLIASTDRDLY